MSYEDIADTLRDAGRGHLVDGGPHPRSIRNDDFNEVCAECGLTRGSHRGDSYAWNQCPGHESRMDWDNGPGTRFKRTGIYREPVHGQPCKQLAVIQEEFFKLLVLDRSDPHFSLPITVEVAGETNSELHDLLTTTGAAMQIGGVRIPLALTDDGFAKVEAADKDGEYIVTVAFRCQEAP